jgi:hypothetical protein
MMTAMQTMRVVADFIDTVVAYVGREAAVAELEAATGTCQVGQ